MSDRQAERNEQDIKKLFELYEDVHAALQGKTGELGIVATMNVHQQALFDKDDGLISWKREVRSLMLKAYGFGFAICMFGGFIGTVIGWWLMYRKGQ